MDLSRALLLLLLDARAPAIVSSGRRASELTEEFHPLTDSSAVTSEKRKDGRRRTADEDNRRACFRRDFAVSGDSTKITQSSLRSSHAD